MAATLPIRSDLAQAHARALARIGVPGTWWTGAERVGIAEEARAATGCSLCSRRRDVLAPGFISGSHERVSELPGPVVDAVHRVAVDPGRISETDYKTWQEACSDAHYVELVGVVSQMAAIDTLAVALGHPLPELPAPSPGAPSRRRSSARQSVAWVPMLPSGGRDQDSMAQYGGASTPHVARALSLVPDEVRALSRLSSVQYVHGPNVPNVSVDGGRALSRTQMELVAARVSALNECFY
jgi:alkylhydroperoxidase family enzyme